MKSEKKDKKLVRKNYRIWEDQDVFIKKQVTKLNKELPSDGNRIPYSESDIVRSIIYDAMMPWVRTNNYGLGR